MTLRLAVVPDETRNYGETDCELLVRREAEVVFGRDVRRCWSTARFVRFLQPETATRAGRLTAKSLAAASGTEALRSRLPNLVPTHGRGPRSLRRRSTWRLLSPSSSRQTRRRRTTAMPLIQPREAQASDRWSSLIAATRLAAVPWLDLVRGSTAPPACSAALEPVLTKGADYRSEAGGGDDAGARLETELDDQRSSARARLATASRRASESVGGSGPDARDCPHALDRVRHGLTRLVSFCRSCWAIGRPRRRAR
jgi:hypothetical protein